MSLNTRFKSHTLLVILVILLAGLLSCKEALTPKPKAFFRIDFPEKEYEKFNSECGFSFDIPVYAEISPSQVRTAEPCWYDISFNDYNATIYLTYKPLTENLSMHVEDVRKIAYKHIIKADDIIESEINIPENKTFGILYKIEGNTASSVNFYLTDSISGFVSGALYFNVKPNKDSLAPAIDFFHEDIVHLINTFDWE